MGRTRGPGSPGPGPREASDLSDLSHGKMWGDGRVYFQVLLDKSIFCYINGHHKQYIQVDIIFNYMFHFGLPGTCL